MHNEVFQPIVDRSRPEMVTTRLRDLIADGSLVEGQQLIESELVAGFGVSRSTIREALQRLIQEGLIIAVPHRGVFVREITRDDIADIYTARLTIETSAALQLAASGDVVSIATLRLAHAEMMRAVETGDISEMTRADQRFHDVLISSIGSSRIDHLARTLRIETRLCLARLEGRYPMPVEAVQEHLELIEAIESGDAMRILGAVNEHMENAKALLLDDGGPRAEAAADASQEAETAG